MHSIGMDCTIEIMMILCIKFEDKPIITPIQKTFRVQYGKLLTYIFNKSVVELVQADPHNVQC